MNLTRGTPMKEFERILKFHGTPLKAWKNVVGVNIGTFEYVVYTSALIILSHLHRVKYRFHLKGYSALHNYSFGSLSQNFGIKIIFFKFKIILRISIKSLVIITTGYFFPTYNKNNSLPISIKLDL